MPKVLRFIIFPEFGIQIREVLVQHMPYFGFGKCEEFSIHPKVKNSGFFTAFDKGKYRFFSNRPYLREQGYAHRPQYCLEYSELKGEYQEAIVKALDEFVMKNFDN